MFVVFSGNKTYSNEETLVGYMCAEGFSPNHEIVTFK